jgi:hypothetical protein
MRRNVHEVTSAILHRERNHAKWARKGIIGMIEHQGGCVCGRVRYTVRGEPERVTICHCTWCQRRTGTAFGVEAVFQQDRVDIAADALNIHRHISDESGRWLDQHFCPACGTNIGITLEAVPGIRTIAAGTFDDPSWIDPAKQKFRYVYMRSAQHWSEVPDGVEQYEVHFRR